VSGNCSGTKRCNKGMRTGRFRTIIIYLYS
jgi:hypothetical protein